MFLANYWDTGDYDESVAEAVEHICIKNKKITPQTAYKSLSTLIPVESMLESAKLNENKWYVTVNGKRKSFNDYEDAFDFFQEKAEDKKLEVELINPEGDVETSTSLVESMWFGNTLNKTGRYIVFENAKKQGWAPVNQKEKKVVNPKAPKYQKTCAKGDEDDYDFGHLRDDLKEGDEPPISNLNKDIVEPKAQQPDVITPEEIARYEKRINDLRQESEKWYAKYRSKKITSTSKSDIKKAHFEKMGDKCKDDALKLIWELEDKGYKFDSKTNKVIKESAQINESYDPEQFEFDIVYKNGENYVVEKTTNRIVASANSGGKAMSLLDYYNTPQGREAAASKFEQQDDDKAYDIKANEAAKLGLEYGSPEWEEFMYPSDQVMESVPGEITNDPYTGEINDREMDQVYGEIKSEINRILNSQYQDVLLNKAVFDVHYDESDIPGIAHDVVSDAIGKVKGDHFDQQQIVDYLDNSDDSEYVNMAIEMIRGKIGI